MATKKFYATRDFKYGTRMMRAGDTVEMTAPHAKLYKALNAISTAKPKRAAAEPEAATEATAEAPKSAARRAPRKRAAKKAQ
jgi:pyruvate/2-oxoglutarate dehydrogenase complex dihydrolipoamide acyltransferase (E2) component